MPAIDVDQLIRDCAVGVAPVTMAAIVKVESGGNPWAIGDNTTRKPVLPKPKNYEEAVKTAKALIAEGHNIDIGLAQINNRNLKWLGLTVEEVLDPCLNLNAGAKVLKLFYTKASDKYGHGTKALMHALSGYNTGSLYKGTPYVERIFAAAKIKHSPSAFDWKAAPQTAYTAPQNLPSYIYPNSAPIMAFGWVEPLEEVANTSNPENPLGVLR
jgi:type IV secretion system protein VirB1